MPVANIIQYLSDKKAVKRPSWGGYARRDNVVDESGALVSYTITFVRRNGDQYVFKHTESSLSWEYVGFVANVGGAKGTTSPIKSTPLVLEEELFEATMISTDWIQGDAEEFEKARSGAGLY